MTTAYSGLYHDHKAFTYWLLFALGVGSFVTTLFAPPVGEEQIYTLTSLEMWYRGEWIHPYLNGILYDRPPMLNWLVIPLANLLGWEHMLVASRLVTAAATVGMALVLWHLVKILTENGDFAAFTALTFLSGDILVKRGWLAYADPLFSFFAFTAIACLLLAVHLRARSLIGLAVLTLSCAFLTKAITAYIFYGTAVLVLLVRSDNRRFLLHPWSLVLHLLALGFPLFWYVYVSAGVHGPAMVQVIIDKLDGSGLWPYLGRLVVYPLRTMVYFLPLSFLALYLLVRNRTFSNGPPSREIVTLLWILGLSFLPYWLAPEGGARYILPIYPLFALMFAWIIWSSGRERVRLAVRLMGGLIILRYAWGIWGLPYYELHYRGGDYAAVAQAITERAGDNPLYTNDNTATGLSVTAEIALQRLPKHPLERAPAQWENGFVISHVPNMALGEVAEQFDFAQNPMYLLCRGDACSDAGENRKTE